MNETQQRAAIRSLEEKQARQEHALEATKAMIELLKGVTLDTKTPKR